MERLSDEFFKYKTQFLETNLTFHTVSVPKIVKNDIYSILIDTLKRMEIKCKKHARKKRNTQKVRNKISQETSLNRCCTQFDLFQ